MLIFILTCPAYAERRLEPAMEQAKSLFPGHQVEAVTGFDAGAPEAVSLYDARANAWRLKRSLTPGEIAAYATHRLAMRRFLDSGADSAIFLEDDFIALDADALRFVADQGSALLPSGADMLKLYDFPRDRQLKKNRPVALVRHMRLELAKWWSVPAGTVGYVITRRGAACFLKRERVFRQIDEDIKYFWELGLDVWSTSLPLLGERSLALGGSRLETERIGRPKTRLHRRIFGMGLVLERKLKCRWHMKSWLQNRNQKQSSTAGG
jgi:glycosyl transferase, family 25